MGYVRLCCVDGCYGSVFTPPVKWGQEQAVCSRHYYAKKSGRVSSNWERDMHNFHRKSKCSWCHVTSYTLGQQVIQRRRLDGDTVEYRFRDIVRLGVQALEGDHIYGRDGPNANYPDNIMTLCSTCHRIKTLAKKDFSPK